MHAASDDPLPLGASHWDRLPRELRIAVAAAAGPLTVWAVGLSPTPGSQRRLEAFLREVWADALEQAWPGPLETLPYVALPMRAYWPIRSRELFERVKALGPRHSEGLRHAAARQRWDDELDFGRPAELASLAAEAGALALLAELVDERQAVEPLALHAELAARSGHLAVVRFLHERMPGGSWTWRVMDRSVRSGSLELVAWLHANRPEGCTAEAMDWAAMLGHLHIIQWLSANRTEGCTTNAMDWAAEWNHLHVVEWLHHNRAEGCTRMAMTMAAAQGHLRMVKFLHGHRTEGCGAAALPIACDRGHADVVAWLLANVDKDWDLDLAFKSAANDDIARAVAEFAERRGISLQPK
ncbi:hypothetical protein HK105_207492 [Polyrhizophydium stewartii]|uniref:Ankyrin repeat protein n=1 Tax=Polyrhizophydium stewartii TaxID=2732419 RepID=A0ABR4N0J7_9FUNG